MTEAFFVCLFFWPRVCIIEGSNDKMPRSLLAFGSLKGTGLYGSYSQGRGKQRIQAEAIEIRQTH